MHPALPRALGVLAVLLAGGTAWYFVREGALRRETVDAALEHGSFLETNQRPAEAAETYRMALEQLELEPAERADLRYRLARAQIESNDLHGALGVLQDLADEDVAQYRIDIGPLYLELGARFQQAGQPDLAKVAYRMGQGVSPARYEEFARRLEEQRDAKSKADEGQD